MSTFHVDGESATTLMRDAAAIAAARFRARIVVEIEGPEKTKFEINRRVSPHGWRDQLAQIWGVLRPEIQWLAQDSDGEWWGYEEKPARDQHSWVGMDDWSLDALVMPSPPCDWTETLVQRPEGQP